MKHMSLCTVLLLCVAVMPALAHNPLFTPQGWSGPYSGGGTTSDHPENLCQNFTQHVCIVAATHTHGIALKKWPIDVSNSAGLFARYLTNDTVTPGWIVVIGAKNLSWTFRPAPGTHNNVTCQMFSPDQAGGIASVEWGSARFYYQAVFNGSFGGSTCVG